MFIRVKRGGNRVHPHDYLQIVESYREGSSVRQRVVATLGRLDQLRAYGQLDGLIKSLCRFSEVRIPTQIGRAFRSKPATL